MTSPLLEQCLQDQLRFSFITTTAFSTIFNHSTDYPIGGGSYYVKAPTLTQGDDFIRMEVPNNTYRTKAFWNKQVYSGNPNIQQDGVLKFKALMLMDPNPASVWYTINYAETGFCIRAYPVWYSYENPQYAHLDLARLYVYSTIDSSNVRTYGWTLTTSQWSGTYSIEDYHWASCYHGTGYDQIVIASGTLNTNFALLKNWHIEILFGSNGTTKSIKFSVISDNAVLVDVSAIYKDANFDFANASIGFYAQKGAHTNNNVVPKIELYNVELNV